MEKEDINQDPHHTGCIQSVWRALVATAFHDVDDLFVMNPFGIKMKASTGLSTSQENMLSPICRVCFEIFPMEHNMLKKCLQVDHTLSECYEQAKDSLHTWFDVDSYLHDFQEATNGRVCFHVNYGCHEPRGGSQFHVLGPCHQRDESDAKGVTGDASTIFHILEHVLNSHYRFKFTCDFLVIY